MPCNVKATLWHSVDHFEGLQRAAGFADAFSLLSTLLVVDVDAGTMEIRRRSIDSLESLSSTVGHHDPPPLMEDHWHDKKPTVP